MCIYIYIIFNESVLHICIYTSVYIYIYIYISLAPPRPPRARGSGRRCCARTDRCGAPRVAAAAYAGTAQDTPHPHLQKSAEFDLSESMIDHHIWAFDKLWSVF